MSRRTPPHTPIDFSRIDEAVAQWYERPLDDRLREVRDHLRTSVVSFHDLRDTPVSPGDADAIGLIYMHIPKTAGTTLESIISRNYSFKDLIHINAPVLRANPRALFKKRTLPIVVMGHHQLSDVVYHVVEGPVAHITVLREPVERFLSYYSYLKTDDEHPLHHRVRSMSIEAFLDAPESIEMHNGQTLRIAGHLHDSALADGGGEHLLEQAKNALDQLYTLVGVTEAFESFLLVAQRVLGWRDLFHEPANRTTGRLSLADLSETEQAAIDEAMRLDRALYQHAAFVAATQAAAVGVDEAAVTQLLADNARYRELVGRAHATREVR